MPCLVDGLTSVVKISCGLSHTLALTKEGNVYAWGQGFYGALGFSQNLLENVFSPKKIEKLERIVDLGAGSRHSVFVGRENVYSCGDGKSGQLGLGYSNQSMDRVMIPTRI